MMKEKLYELGGSLRTTYQKKINDTHIWASIAYEAIEAAQKNIELISENEIRVPSKSPSKTRKILRTKEELQEIIDSALDEDFNYSIFTFIVAQVEAFLLDLIGGVLRIDKRRLKTRVQGIDHVGKLEISEIIDSEDIDDVIEKIINKELASVFYASPDKQFEYIEKVVAIKFDEKLTELANRWKEYKATRDIIVHNSGIANDLYIKKSGKYSKWKSGEKVKIEKKYLNELVAESKSLVGKICTSLQGKRKA